MELEQFLEYLNQQKPVTNGSEEKKYMTFAAHEAMKVTSDINSGYHSPEELRILFSKLIGKPVDNEFGLFPPFYTDFGKNITLGKGVFINAGCKFQDQGGIYIDDYALIGHNAVLATLNHGFSPERRHDLYPKPIHIGKRVWLGANVTVLPGVTIGDNAIIAAGAVVTENVPANTVFAGVPARFIKTIEETKD